MSTAVMAAAPTSGCNGIDGCNGLFDSCNNAAMESASAPACMSALYADDMGAEQAQQAEVTGCTSGDSANGQQLSE